MKTKKLIVSIILISILYSGCSFKKQLPISPDVYLKDYEISLPDAQKKLQAGEQSEGFHEQPPSFKKNVAFKDEFDTPQYVIGPGDILKITDWKSTGPSNITTVVRPDGNISYSFFEDLKVLGLTATEVDNLITDKVKNLFKNPRIDVIVDSFNSKKISISGPIKILRDRGKTGSGTYPLKGKATLLKSLLDAGGFGDGADISRIKLKRGGKTYIVNLAEQMKSTIHDASKDIILEAGDFIIVPEFKRLEKKKEDPNTIYVFGEVNKVGVHSLLGDINILDAISKAGGFKQSAKKSDVRIIRGTPENPVVVKTDIKRLFKKNDLTQLLSIKDGDIIFVASTTLGKIDDFSKRISEFLDLAQKPAIYRDLYTTGGFGRLDTGPPITGRDEDDGLGGVSGGAPSNTVDSVDLIIRGQ